MEQESNRGKKKTANGSWGLYFHVLWKIPSASCKVWQIPSEAENILVNSFMPMRWETDSILYSHTSQRNSALENEGDYVNPLHSLLQSEIFHLSNHIIESYKYFTLKMKVEEGFLKIISHTEPLTAMCNPAVIKLWLRKWTWRLQGHRCLITMMLSVIKPNRPCQATNT